MCLLCVNEYDLMENENNYTNWNASANQNILRSCNAMQSDANLLHYIYEGL